MKLSFKSAVKLVGALVVALPLLMVGCTCSKQDNSDQVVPMEDPGMNEATPSDSEGPAMDDAAPAMDENMAPADDGGGSMDQDQPDSSDEIPE